MSKKKIRFVIIVFSAVSMLVSALLLFWVSLNETIESYSKNASQYYETAL